MLTAEPFTKSGAAPLTRQRLRNEAVVLRRAAHPDVVRLVGLFDVDDHTQLHTERVGDDTLLTAAPTDGDAALAVAATIAATVADLHEIDLVHGRLGPDHVLMRADGRPVICGLAEAGTGNPAVDIRALGTLFELLASGLSRSTSRRANRSRTVLLTAAEQARTGSPMPSAADLVKAISAPRRRFDPPRRQVLLGVGAAAAIVTLAGLTLRSFSGSGDPSVFTLAPAEAASSSTAPPSSTTPSTGTTPSTNTNPSTGTNPWTGTNPSTEASPTSTQESSTSTEVDREPVRFEAGGVIYAAGAAGDIVVVGDWDCDGVAGAALLQPSDGDIFVFDQLAGPHVPVTGRLVGKLPEAVDLEVIDQENGCSTLTARFADGSPHLIPVGAR